MCLANGLIMVLEMQYYSIGDCINSLVYCIITFGEAEGYVRALEIHDITFLFGQFLVYYAIFAPRDTKEERQRNHRNIGFAIFFMLVGLKRSTFPAALLMIIVGTFISKRKYMYRWIFAVGIGIIAFFWLYLYLVHTGIFADIMNSLGIDMMGRDYFWSMANDYYEFSPRYMGRGFEAVDSIVYSWYCAGLINHAYPFHNDILKVFVEIGFVGFNFWTIILYVFYPFCFYKRNGSMPALVYLMLLSYMSVTYLTDNSAFYFWDSIGLRLIPLSYAFGCYNQEKKNKWRPHTSEEVLDSMWSLEQNNN
jgi:hypothetical protein